MSSTCERTASHLAVVLVLILAAGTSGCGAQHDARSAAANDALDVRFSDDPSTVEYSTGLSYGAEDGLDFDFCPFANDLNLLNAQWLAFFSANQYAHFGYVAPLLESLGFGVEGEGREWALCARDLYALRDLETSGQLPSTVDSSSIEGWGECFRTWFEPRFGSGERALPPALTASFEHYLIHEPHPDAMIQFFSSGAFEVDGMSFDAGTTQVMWARHREMPLVIIAFRGTEMRRGQLSHDAICDLRFGMEPWEGWGRVHRGFSSGLDAVDASLLRSKLEEVEGTGAAIWITGHSLGAALATLMMARIIEEKDRGADLTIGGLYTFGSPRVGDAEFAQTFDDAVERLHVTAFRFRHANDVVTRIPVSVFGQDGYEHVGRLVYLTRDGEMSVEPEQIPGGLYRFFSDHSSTNYYERIRDLAADPANARLLRCER